MSVTQIPSSIAWMQVANLAMSGMGPCVQMQAAINQAMSFGEASARVQEMFSSAVLESAYPVRLANNALFAASEAIDADVAAGRFGEDKDLFRKAFTKRCGQLIKYWERSTFNLFGLDVFLMIKRQGAVNKNKQITVPVIDGGLYSFYEIPSGLMKGLSGSAALDVIGDLSGVNPEAVASAREQLIRIINTLPRLSQIEYDSIFIRAFDELTPSEIAAQNGVGRSAVEMAKGRALKKLAYGLENTPSPLYKVMAKAKAVKIAKRSRQEALERERQSRIVREMIEQQFMKTNFKVRLRPQERLDAVIKTLIKRRPSLAGLIIEEAKYFAKDLKTAHMTFLDRVAKSRARSQEILAKKAKSARAAVEKKQAEEGGMKDPAQYWREYRAAERQRKLEDERRKEREAEHKRWEIKQKKWQRENGFLKD